MKNILLVFAVLIFSACTAKTPQMELSSNIDKMILLIDEGNSKELIANHADVSGLKTIPTSIPEHKLVRLKTFLLKAKEIKPVLSEDKSTATFSDSSFGRPIVFIKSGDKWLLQN